MEHPRKDSTIYHQRIGPILVDQPLPNLKDFLHIRPPSYPPPEDASSNKLKSMENTPSTAPLFGCEAPEYEDPDLDDRTLSSLSHARKFSTSPCDLQQKSAGRNNSYHHCQNDYEVAISSRGSTRITPYTRLLPPMEEQGRRPLLSSQKGAVFHNHFSIGPPALQLQTQLYAQQGDPNNSTSVLRNDDCNACPATRLRTTWRNSCASTMNRAASGSGFYFDPNEVDTSLLSSGGRRSCDTKSGYNNTTSSSLMSAKHKMQQQPRGILFPPPPPLNASPVISSQNMRKRKLSGSLSSTSFLPCNMSKSVLLVLLLLLLLAFLALVYFLVSQTGHSNYSYYNNDNGGVLYGGNTQDSSAAALRSFPAGQLLPLPSQINLGQVIHADLPARRIVYTQFSVQHDSQILFNISIGPQSRLVLYARQTLEPTPSLYDFQRIISADHLHLTGAKPRATRDVTDHNVVVKHALLSYFMLSGRWFLGFLNDDLKPQSIDLLAITTPYSLKPDESDSLSQLCQYDCFGKGVCKQGKCHCHPGYSGKHCEETACPVLCSGNGVFSNGHCVCHEGFKGPECDLLVNWCALPNCNYHGRCSLQGQCVCDSGWSGEFCDKPSCVDPSCSGHGICQDSHCYCVSGWWGQICEQSFDGSKMCAFASERKMPGGELLTFAMPKDNIAEKTEIISIQKVRDVSIEVNRVEELNRPQWGCTAGCLNGLCTNGSCHCSAGWIGKDCSNSECIQGCAVHGHCEGHLCVCDRGWNGENCFIEGCLHNCSGNGQCTYVSDQWKCFCDAEHYGLGCQFSKESDCEDEVDNDNDGLVDCEDSECCSSDACSSNSMCLSPIQPRDALFKIETNEGADFYHKIKFLFDGSSSVQKYADQKLLNKRRISVIRGRVLSSLGGPLTGVRVSDADNNQQGFSISRSDDGGGSFDLVVNGGGLVRVLFVRQPYGKLTHSFYVPWNQIVYVGDVFMDNNQTVKSLDKPINIAQMGVAATSKCQAYRIDHSIRPKFLEGWKMSQHASYYSSFSPNTQVYGDSGIVLQAIPLNLRFRGSMFAEALVYNSERAKATQSVLYMSLLGKEVPFKLRLVHVHIDVAGRHFEDVFSATSELMHTFWWDKKNVYGQLEQGLVDANVKIGYEYDECEIIWENQLLQLEGTAPNQGNLIPGPWTLNFQHRFDAVKNVVYKGDGSKLYLDNSVAILSTVFGSESRRSVSCVKCKRKEQLSKAELFLPMALAISPDGAVFVGDFNLIRKISADENEVESVLELNTMDTGHQYYLAVNPSTGALMISLPLRRQVWQVNELPDSSKNILNNYHVFAGDGNTCSDTGLTDSCGDGDLATRAQLSFPKGLAFDTLGNMFIADGRKLRIVTSSGKIFTVIADHPWKPTSACAASFSIQELNMEWPTSIAFDQSSDAQQLFVLDSQVLYQIDLTSQLVHVLAGVRKGCQQVAGFEALKSAQAITVDYSLGRVLVAESDGKRMNHVRSVPITKAGDNVEIIAGRVGKCDCHPINCPCDDADSSPLIAIQALLHKPVALAIHPNGNVYVADQGNYKIKRIEAAKVQLNKFNNMYTLNSPATDEIYHFDYKGHHSSTTYLLSGQLLYNFSYTSEQQLSKVLFRGKFELEIEHKSITEISLKCDNGHKIHLTATAEDKELLESVADTSTGSITTLDYGEDNQLLVKKASNVEEPVYFAYQTPTFTLSNVTDAAGSVFGLDTPVFESASLATRITKNGLPFKEFLSNQNELIEKQGNSFTKLTATQSGFAVDWSTGQKTLFEKIGHPLLLPNEEVVLKQKTSLPEVNQPSRRQLNNRLEWRNHLGRGSHAERANRIVQVNGRNVFTVQFDRTQLTDTLIDNYDNDLLELKYNPSGQLVSLHSNPSAVAEAASHMYVNYTTQSLPSLISWQDQVRQLKYDNENRIVEFSVAGTGVAGISRKFFYNNNTSKFPSAVQIGSEEGNFTWILEKNGLQIVGLTPSGEKHQFSVTNVGSGSKLYTHQFPESSKRQGKGVTISYSTTYDANNQLVKFASGENEFFVRRDKYGRIERLNYSKSDSFQFTYDEHDRISNIACPTTNRSFTYQGSLLLSTNVKIYSAGRDLLNSVHFNYEYDDLLKLIGLAALFNETLLIQQRFEYYPSSGFVHKMANCTFEYSSQKRRISHQMFYLDTHYLADKRPSQLLLFSSARAQVLEASFTYDALGRLTKTIWTVGGQTQTSEERIYNADGQLSKVVLSKGHQWTLSYDQNRRLQQINGLKIKLGAGGLVQKLGDMVYRTDQSGWTIQRGSSHFDYDSIGQLVQVKRSGQVDGTEGQLQHSYAYDDQNRLIRILDSRNGHHSKVYTFHYAFPYKPYLISHYTSSYSSGQQLIWTIHYSHEDEPILLENSSGQRFVIVVDPYKSARFIVDHTGAIVRELVYSPFGQVVEDSNSDLFFPLGYNGQFQDFEADIVFIRQSKVLQPLDCFGGQFMSLSIPSFATSLDFLHPERMANPWSFNHNTQPWAIPIDVGSWLKLSGVDFEHISFMESSRQRQSDKDLFSPFAISSAGHHCYGLISSQLCAFQSSQLQLSQQLLTMKPVSDDWPAAKHPWSNLQDHNLQDPFGPISSIFFV